ncbi:MAG: Ig-like domain-containing protein [Clostridia bacterium]|nr:Ig-like domain-containing protein [Clostridia bacterium]
MKKKLFILAVILVVSVIYFTLPAMAEEGYIYSLDLSGYEVGAEPEGLDSETYCVTDNLESSDDNPGAGTDGFVVKEATVDGNTLRYVEYGGMTASAKSNAFGYRFDSSYTESFAVDLDVKFVSGTGGRSFRRIGSGTSLLSFTNVGSANNPTSDAFGFHRLRIVCEKISDTQYTITSYDRLNDYNMLRTKTDNIKGWEGINVYMWGNNTAKTAIARMDIFPYTSPKAEGINTASLTADEDELIVEFDKNMDEALFTDSSFILKDETAGRTVATSFSSYDSVLRQATITLHEYLDDAHQYKLTFSGIADTFGLTIKEEDGVAFETDFDRAEVTDVVFTDSQDAPIDSLAAVVNPKAKVTVANIPEGGSVSVLLALFDDNGRLVDADCQSAEAEGDVTAALTGSVEIEEGFVLKCYIWETTAEGMTALWEEAKILE